MLSLKNRTCVFVGGSGNIGRGAVQALSQGGMNVALVTHSPERAAGIIKECETHRGRVVALGNEHGDNAALKTAYELFGSVDVIIISSGGLAPIKPFEEISEDMLSSKLNHQVIGAFSFVKAAVPYLKNSTAPRVILVSSAGAQDGFKGENIADSIARGGVISMTYALARELAPFGITVNCISRSAMINDHPPRPDGYNSEDAVSATILKHLGDEKNFGALVEYIASEESSHTTGHIYNLTGGIHIG